jgi:hypothetical protein
VCFEESAWSGEDGAYDEEDEIGVKLCGGLAEGGESMLGLKSFGVFWVWLPRWIEIGWEGD